MSFMDLISWKSSEPTDSKEPVDLKEPVDSNESVDPSEPWEDDEEIPEVDVFQRSPTEKKHHPIFWSLFFLVFGLLGGYAYIELVWLWQSMATMPMWMKWTSWAFLALFTVLTLGSFLRLSWIYLRMQRNRQLYLEDLDQRSKIQEQSSSLEEQTKHQMEICKALQKFVQRYPAESISQNPFLNAQLKKEKKTPEEFQKTLESLRSASIEETSSGQWLEAYRDFQKTLDVAANRRLKVAERYVGFKTGISPYPFLDMLIVFYWSFKFMGEMCQLYNLRVDTLNTCRLVMKMWINGIFAMGIDQAEEIANASLQKGLEAATGNKITSFFIGGVAAKTAAGIANAFLFHRLGRAAIAQLRPLAEKRK